MKAALQTFLKEHESVIAPIAKEYALAVWGSSTLGTPEAEERTANARKALLSVYADKAAFEKVKWFRSVGTTGDELLDRQLTLVYNAFAPNQMPPEMISELVDAEKEVESLFHNYRAEFEGRHATDNELKDLLRHEADPARRKTVWEATKQIGAKAAPLVLKVVRLRNEIARTEGFRDHFAMALHFQELDEPKLFAIFDELREATRLPFRKSKSEIDQAIAKLARISPAELRPWHYEDPFFQEAPAHGTMSLEKYFRNADPVALTMDTFRKFGFDVSDIIARSDLYEREGKEQHAFCIHIDKSGDVRVLANVKNDEYWTGTMLHEVGHAVYDKHLDPALPFLLREPAHTLTTEAVAMMVGRLNRSVEWIMEELSVSENEARSLQAPLRNALHAKLLIFIRWAMVVTEFEREMYGNPDADLQSIWWSLVEKNQEIHVDAERKCAGAAGPAGSATADWASKIHISLFPVYYQNYVLGELMASQLGRALAKGVGSNKPGVYVGKKGVADWLTKNLFHLGARYRWDETILRATGEHLNPKYLLADETA